MARTIDTTATKTIVRTENFDRLAADIRRTPVLSSEEEVELFNAYAIAEGVAKEAIKQRIANANLRFVLSIAKKYSSDASVVADLVSLGTIGLYNAIEDFDLNCGFKFISYAVHKIRAEFSEHFRLNGTIVRRTNNSVIGSKDIKVAEKLYQQLEREPSEDEIIDALESEYGIELKSRYDVLRVKADYLSDSYGEDGTVEENGEVAVVTASHNDYEDEVEAEANKDATDRLLATLSITERDIVCRAFGIGYDRAYEYDEIGAQLGYTGERIRQICTKALAKMKDSAKRVLAM